MHQKVVLAAVNTVIIYLLSLKKVIINVSDTTIYLVDDLLVTF